jgi:hypothetical protein
MILGGHNRNTCKKFYPCATLSTTNPTLTDLGSSPGTNGERAVKKSLSRGLAWADIVRNLPLTEVTSKYDITNSMKQNPT